MATKPGFQGGFAYRAHTGLGPYERHGIIQALTVRVAM